MTLDRFCCYCAAAESLNADGRCASGFRHTFLFRPDDLKPQNERCQKWIRGAQCDNYRAQGRKMCSVHDRRIAALREP